MAYVISDDCIACGTCIDECPVGAISEGDKYHIDPDCSGLSRCLGEIEEVSEEEAEDMGRTPCKICY